MDLKILILEDDAVDARLIEQELQRSHLAHTSKVVMTEADFMAGLEYYRPDIILADYRVPRFDGLAALAVARRRCPEVPFIFVSGVMGEELAVEALKSGATDYVIKEKMGRLTPAILRALREVQERNERKRSEAIREALYRISELSAATSDMDRFYREIHETVKSLIPVNNLYIALHDQARGVLTFPYYCDDRDSAPMDRTLGNGFTDYVIRSGQPLLVTLENREQLLSRLGLKGYGTPAVDWLGLPLKNQETTFGALAIQSYDPQYRLGETEQDLMAFVSQHIAGALLRKQALEVLQRSALELEEKVRQRTEELAQANQALRLEIAERQKTEAALRSSEQRYRFLFEEGPTINIIIQANGTVKDVNRAALEQMGYTKEEVVGYPVLRFVAFEQREAVLADLEKNFRGETTPETQVDVLARDGSRRTILFTQKNVMIQEEGQPPSILISGIDITDRRRSDEERMKYVFSVNASKDLMTLIRRDQVYEAANEAYCQAHRKPREEIVGRTVEQVWGAEAARVIAQYLEQCFQGQEVHYQKWFEFAALGRRFFDVAYYPYRNQEGEITHVVVVSRDLTDYKLAEDRIAESQRRLATLLSNLPGMAYRQAPGSEFLEFVSQGCLEITGYRPEQLSEPGGVPYRSLVFAEDREMVAVEIQNARESRQPFQIIYRIHDAGGEEKWIWEQGRWIYDEQGRPLACEGFVADITDRKRAELALWEKEQHYRSLFENMPIGVYRSNPDGQILMANPFLVRMLGYDSLAELQKINLEKQDVYGPGHSRRRFKELMEKQGLVLALESEWRRRDGSIIYVKENATAGRDASGRIVYYEGTVEDVTEQRRTRLLESALFRLSETANISRNLEEFYRSLHGIIGQMMYARNFYIALVDPAAKMLTFPYFVDERDPRPEPQPLGDGITEYVIATGQPLLANGDTIRNMVTAGIFSYQGTPDCSWLGVPLMREERAFGALVVHSYSPEHLYHERDRELLTLVSQQIAMAIERKRAEEDRQRLVAAVEQAADGVSIAGPDGVISYSNPALGELLGGGEILGRRLEEVLGPNFLQAGRQLKDLLARGRPWQGQFTMSRADGSEFEAEATVSPIMDSEGRITDMVVAVRDVTEQKRLRSIAEAVNTMENIGYVFSGIRHEIGNALTSIKMAIGILSKNWDNYPKETIVRVIEMAAKEVSRMEDLLRSLKNFSMYESLKPEEVEVNQFLEKIRLLAAEDFRKRGIAIETRMHPEPITARLDPRALQQVLLNLLANASDALGGRSDGRILITSSRDNGTVEIAVEDNGCGIAPDQMKNLFKPFHTSKPSGTGLGLVISKNIMVKMQGEIDVESRFRQGTRVVLRLPALGR